MRYDFFAFFDRIGLIPSYLLNGFVGGLVWAVYNKSKFWESVRQVFIGMIVSGYCTPFIIEKTSINYAGFISFSLGVVGMVLVELLYGWAVKKLKLLFG